MVQTSKGYLAEWTVRNAPEDNGQDRRHVQLHLVVATGSQVSASVAALSGVPCRLQLELKGYRAAWPCLISPPWGASKRAGFQFRAVLEYSAPTVEDLERLTCGEQLLVGLELVQQELGLDQERQQLLRLLDATGRHSSGRGMVCTGCGQLVEGPSGLCPDCGEPVQHVTTAQAVLELAAQELRAQGVDAEVRPAAGRGGRRRGRGEQVDAWAHQELADQDLEREQQGVDA